jgi:hypothetical protein
MLYCLHITLYSEIAEEKKCKDLRVVELSSEAKSEKGMKLKIAGLQISRLSRVRANAGDEV